VYNAEPIGGNINSIMAYERNNIMGDAGEKTPSPALLYGLPISSRSR
jgi:hypothetical protein